MKVNKKTEIISVCCPLYLCHKISIKKPLFDISHIQSFFFQFNVSYKQNTNLNKVFHLKSPI